MMTFARITGARAHGVPRLATPTLALASLLSLALSLAGCETTPPAGPSASLGAGSATQAHARLIDAYNQCNEAAFVGAFAPLFTLATSNTKQPVTTRDGLQRYLASGCGSRPNPTAALVQQSARVSGAITVLAGQYRFRVPLGGTPAPGAPAAAPQMIEVPQNFTLVLERMGERWFVLAHHVSVAP
ncbi:MAG: nuclear transport factor 2 family protein [Burkholderiales bacterium]|nr:nuclear transport factor 2 family protein [Burkholderiales bacterium]